MIRRIVIFCLLTASVCRGQITSNGDSELRLNGTLVGVIDVDVPTNVCPTCPTCPAVTNCLPCDICSNAVQAPYGIHQTGSTTSSTTISWTNGSPFATNFVAWGFAYLPGNATSFTYGGMQPGQPVTLLVGGLGAPAITTTNAPPVTGLQAPTGLTATSTAPGSVTLNWTQPGTLSGIWIVTNGTMSSFTPTSNGTAYAATESGFKSGVVITNTVYAHDSASPNNSKSASVIGVVQ